MLVACGGVEPPVISHTRYRSNFVRFACKERAVILQAAYNMGNLGGQASALSIGILAPLRSYAASICTSAGGSGSRSRPSGVQGTKSRSSPVHFTLPSSLSALMP